MSKAVADDSTSMVKRLREGFPFGAVVIGQDQTISLANTSAARLLEVDQDELQPGCAVSALVGKLAARGDYGDGESRITVDHILSQIGTDSASFTQKTPQGTTLSVSIGATLAASPNCSDLK